MKGPPARRACNSIRCIINFSSTNSVNSDHAFIALIAVDKENMISEIPNAIGKEGYQRHENHLLICLIN
jgi:hypothetical protein